LISDILDLSKIESGTVDGRRRGNIDLEPAGDRRPAVQARGGKPPALVNISVDENLGRSMVTDSKRLQQVLKNLLSNAFKFTAEGGVRMSVSRRWAMERRAPDPEPCTRRVAFEVTDTGIGIPPENRN